MTDLHGFRRRSLVERLFWSVPLSLALSTITSVLVARVASSQSQPPSSFCASRLHHLLSPSNSSASATPPKRGYIGLRPYRPNPPPLSLSLRGLQIFSLVDFQRGQRLHMSLTFYGRPPHQLG